MNCFSKRPIWLQVQQREQQKLKEQRNKQMRQRLMEEKNKENITK